MEEQINTAKHLVAVNRTRCILKEVDSGDRSFCWFFGEYSNSMVRLRVMEKDLVIICSPIVVKTKLKPKQVLPPNMSPWTIHCLERDPQPRVIFVRQEGQSSKLKQSSVSSSSSLYQSVVHSEPTQHTKYTQVELEDIDVDAFKKRLNLFKLRFRRENMKRSESEGRRHHLEIQSIGTPDNEYDNFTEATLEEDLNISFDSSESELDDVRASHNCSEDISNIKDFDVEKVINKGSSGSLQDFKKRLDPFFAKVDSDSDSSENEIVLSASVDKKFNNNLSIKGHDEEKFVINIEKPECSQVTCEYCEMKFSYANYVIHCKIKHPQANFTIRKCSICFRKVFSFIWEFHQLNFHKNPAQQKKEFWQKERIHDETTCPHCGSVVSKRNLRRHIGNNVCRQASGGSLMGDSGHAKENFVFDNEEPDCSKVKCEYCEMEFSYRNYVKHCEIKHPKENLTTKRCSICSRQVYSFIWEFHQLKFHQIPAQQKNEIEQNNNNNEAATCPHCGIKVSKSKLNRHISRSCRLASGGSLVADRDEIPDVSAPAVIKMLWCGKILKIRSPGDLSIYLTMKKLSKKVGFHVKMLKFKHREQVLRGSEKAGMFDGKVIKVTMNKK